MALDLGLWFASCRFVSLHARSFLVMAGPFLVMVGLGPAIHVFLQRQAKSWIPAPGAGMTRREAAMT